MKKSLSDLSILIADDSRAQRERMQQICNELGLATIYHANNGMDAIAILQKNIIDIVLIDLEMPIVDGVELIRSIAQFNFSCGIIILSAKDPILISSVGTMAEAQHVNVLGTFQKPLHIDMLKCSFMRFINEQQNAQDSTTEISALNSPPVTGLELSHAINNDDIILAYQPKLTVKGLLLRGVEALARWKHPQKGLISPLIFIPMAERLGLITALTYKLYEKAMKDKQDWQERGMSFHVAFNLSPISLADENLVDWLTTSTYKHGVMPQDVTLEITEGTVLNELASAIRTLARLRLKGFNVAIDDYGTGYANTQQLSRIPATELKLDRSLVHGISVNPQQRIILANTIALAKNLELISVAEGVEMIEDYHVLLELGVDQVQGFYFSKPLFPDDLLRFVKTGLSQIRLSIPLSL